jgi:hypothetical protein
VHQLVNKKTLITFLFGPLEIIDIYLTEERKELILGNYIDNFCLCWFYARPLTLWRVFWNMARLRERRQGACEELLNIHFQQID